MLFVLFFLVLRPAWGACADDPNFVATNGLRCSAWAGVDCQTHSAGLSQSGLAEVLRFCPVTCKSCIPAAEQCDVGGSPAFVTLASQADVDGKLTFAADELLTSGPCEWVFSGSEGVRQTSNAYGDTSDALLGCLAILKNPRYVDFALAVDVEASDNDGLGLVFGYNNAPSDRYQVTAINDRWPETAADSVPGPHLKMKRRNPAKPPCAKTMSAAENCFDLLSYVADDSLMNAQAATTGTPPPVYPGNKLASASFVPEPYATEYHGYPSRFTFNLVVKNKQARAYFKAEDGATVGTWADLPNYNGGNVGFFTYAMQGVTFSNLRITDLSLVGATAAQCADPSLTCDTHLGLCCPGGQCIIPTQRPTPAPTFDAEGLVPNPQVCPGAAGPSATRLADFDFMEHEDLTEPCAWEPDNAGIKQTSNAYGNAGINTLMGCLALTRSANNNLRDFIAEMDVVSYDNDGVGMVFGFQGLQDHYIALAVNDVRILFAGKKKITSSQCSSSGPRRPPTASTVPSSRSSAAIPGLARKTCTPTTTVRNCPSCRREKLTFSFCRLRHDKLHGQQDVDAGRRPL